MIPQYQFNLGQQDPLLANKTISTNDYIQNIEQEMNRLNIIKQQMVQNINSGNNINNNQQQTAINFWEDIDKEVASLNDDQKQILSKDETYNSIGQELQILIQQELVNSVKNKVANTEYGKELLEKQLKNIKDKKSKIIEESNKEIELFKKFQIAIQANPNLTYAEFIKTIK